MNWKVPLLTLILGTLFGSGAVWQWLDHKVKDRSQVLETAMKTTELRKQSVDLYRRVVELSDQYIKVQAQYSGRPHNPDLHNRLHQLQSELKLAKDDFRALENKLAPLALVNK